MQKNYLNKKEFVFRGKSNPPDIWASNIAKRYSFESNFWMIYAAMSTYERLTPFGNKIFEGELERCDGETVLQFYLDGDLTILINTPFKQYVEGYDRVPVPKYVLNMIRTIHNNLLADEHFYDKTKPDNLHYTQYSRKEQKRLFK